MHLILSLDPKLTAAQNADLLRSAANHIEQGFTKLDFPQSTTLNFRILDRPYPVPKQNWYGITQSEKEPVDD